MAEVIFDIEATCEDKDINPNYNMETIEIGAVKVEDGVIVDEFQTFIKPEYVDKLTDFCTNLTGITFADLENAPNFNEGILEFYAFMYGSIIYSCGEFDRKFLTREIIEKGLSRSHKMAKNAINSNHVNMKKYFDKITGKGMKEIVPMLEDLGMTFEGTLHRGLDDSRNLARIYLELENIRGDKLNRVFTKDKLEDMIANINQLHDKNFILNDNSIIDGGVKYTLVEFLDIWKNLIEKDHLEMNCNYLSNYDIDTLNKYTKDLIEL